MDRFPNCLEKSSVRVTSFSHMSVSCFRIHVFLRLRIRTRFTFTFPNVIFDDRRHPWRSCRVAVSKANKLGLLLKGGYKPYSQKRKNFGLPKLATLSFMVLFSECHYFYFDVNRHFNCPNKCFETCCTYIPLNNLMNVCSSLFFGLRVGEEGTLVFSLLHLSNGGGRNR